MNPKREPPTPLPASRGVTVLPDPETATLEELCQPLSGKADPIRRGWGTGVGSKYSTRTPTSLARLSAKMARLGKISKKPK